MTCCNANKTPCDTSEQKSSGTCCDKKKFILAAFVGFIFVFLHQMLVHGYLLSGFYNQTPDLWRTPADMQSHFYIAVAGQFFTALLVTVIASVHKKCGCPLRLILAVSALIGVLHAVTFAWMPISATLAVLWFITSFLETLILFTIVYAVLSGGKCCWSKCGAFKMCCCKGSCQCSAGQNTPSV